MELHIKPHHQRALPQRHPRCKMRNAVRVSDFSEGLVSEFLVGAPFQEWIDPQETPVSRSWYLRWGCSTNSEHVWLASLSERGVRGLGCPYCSGRKILVGDNDIATHHPELIRMWSDKNDYLPTEVTRGSRKSMVLNCLSGHEYSVTAKNYSVLGRRCPYCSGTRVGVDKNIGTDYPEIMQYWHPDNPPVAEFGPSTRKVVKFRCPVDNTHEWSTLPENQVRRMRCPFCSGHLITIGQNDLASTHPELANEWDFQKNDLPPQSYKFGSSQSVWWTCPRDAAHSYEASITHRTYYQHGCPECSTSGIENWVYDLVRDIVPDDVDILRRDRVAIKPMELDIYIPSMKIGIEVNGVYWHSDKFHDKGRHLRKWKMADDAGITLIVLWEDDLTRKRQIVEAMLRHKLGYSKQPCVPARKTLMRVASVPESKDFLNRNHIQGFVGGALHLALVDKETDNIVAMSVWGKSGTEASLRRYATSVRLPGGMGKIIAHAAHYLPGETERIVTFADREVSCAESYYMLGFSVDKVLAPDYTYLYKNRRHHKFSFRKERFLRDPELQFDPDMTERELAALNGIVRCWDSGKLRLVKQV